MFYVRRLSSITIAAAIFTALVASFAVAAPPGAAPGQNKIQCFADPPGVCTLNSNGAKGSANLDTTAGGVAGVYFVGFNDSFYGVQLSQITKLSFTVIGTPGIDPHWSIPIDTNNDGNTEAFAFVASGTCNNGTGLVDVIGDATCSVNYLGTDYPNWAAFVAAQPAISEVALTDNYAFVIADTSGGLGYWTVSNLTVGKPGK